MEDAARAAVEVKRSWPIFSVDTFAGSVPRADKHEMIVEQLRKAKLK
jgi:hypothetical protein